MACWKPVMVLRLRKEDFDSALPALEAADIQPCEGDALDCTQSCDRPGRVADEERVYERDFELA